MHALFRSRYQCSKTPPYLAHIPGTPCLPSAFGSLCSSNTYTYCHWPKSSTEHHCVLIELSAKVFPMPFLCLFTMPLICPSYNFAYLGNAFSFNYLLLPGSLLSQPGDIRDKLNPRATQVSILLILISRFSRRRTSLHPDAFLSPIQIILRHFSNLCVIEAIPPIRGLRHSSVMRIIHPGITSA